MIHYPHNQEEEEIKTKYSKGIKGSIERFCGIIKILLFVFVFLGVGITFYWLIHWVIFGRNVYSDIFDFADKYSN